MYIKKIKFLQINIITHIHTHDSIANCKKKCMYKENPGKCQKK